MQGWTPKLASVAALAVGAASWMYVAQITGRREAWDSEIYFTTVLPALAVLAAGIGMLVPDRAWRWAFLPFAGQAMAAFVQNPTANLLPLGLIVFAFFGAFCLVPAYLGAWIGRRLRGAV
jgi:hypothetical protein